MTRHRGRFSLAVFAAALSLLALTDRGAYAETEWVNALRQGGYAIVFRHGATHQDQADTDPLNPQNVAQQRQLNDAGRAKPKKMPSASSESLSASSRRARSIARSRAAS